MEESRREIAGLHGAAIAAHCGEDALEHDDTETIMMSVQPPRASRGARVALLAMAVYWSPLARVMSVADPGVSGWTLAMVASVMPLGAGQLLLLYRARADAV